MLASGNICDRNLLKHAFKRQHATIQVKADQRYHLVHQVLHQIAAPWLEHAAPMGEAKVPSSQLKPSSSSFGVQHQPRRDAWQAGLCHARPDLPSFAQCLLPPLEASPTSSMLIALTCPATDSCTFHSWIRFGADLQAGNHPDCYMQVQKRSTLCRCFASLVVHASATCNTSSTREE